jgi:hypothetical protein
VTTPRLGRLPERFVVFAQEVKHDTTPTRRDAGVAADSVILLGNVLRRLRSPKRAATALKRLAVRKGPSQWPGPGVGEGLRASASILKS